jgi:hypothetical protein
MNLGEAAEISAQSEKSSMPKREKTRIAQEDVKSQHQSRENENLIGHGNSGIQVDHQKGQDEEDGE